MKKLRWLAKQVRVENSGKPTKKVRHRLRQFDDRETLKRLLQLPKKLMDQALDPDTPFKEALLFARESVMIGILCRIPLRIGNLVSIVVGRNLRFSGEQSEVVTLGFQEYETKNWMEVEFYVGTRLQALLRVYIKRFLPEFARHSADASENRWLFPSGGGRSGPLTTGQAHKIIKRAIAVHVGATVNPHLFRALAVKLAMEHDGGALDHCRLILGDRSLSVILKHYAAYEEKGAARRHDAMVDDLEQQLAACAPRAAPTCTRHAR